MGGKVIFVFLVYLVILIYKKKNKVNFLDEKDGADERDEIDLLAGRRERTGTRLDRSHSLELDNYHGEKDATKMPLKLETAFKFWYNYK
jgi:hypothetical protein